MDDGACDISERMAGRGRQDMQLGLGKEGLVLTGRHGHLKERYFYPAMEGKTWRVLGKQTSRPYLIALVDSGLEDRTE